jgi:hypothetical protein
MKQREPQGLAFCRTEMIEQILQVVRGKLWQNLGRL